MWIGVGLVGLTVAFVVWAALKAASDADDEAERERYRALMELLP